ncbi:MAG TPA: Ldh family oxidoreductase [Pyrinomonadaceae bacterium]|jgi:LDH2 family malate/lactate/ureidoglycolate dehydrogenase
MNVPEPETDARAYPAERLREFTTRVFSRCGVPEASARQAADVLVTADLWGIDSHGVARLRNYYDMLARGRVNPRPEVKVVREFAATATLDGDNGLGLVVGPAANGLALDKAAAAGAGWVGVRNSSHFGIAGYYARAALGREMIGWAMTNTTPQTAPLWGAEKMLGTNPIAVAFPAREEPPVLIDMATSATAYGRIENALRRSTTIPPGLAIDRDGHETTQPREMMEGGALLPLGHDREHGGHKGYCLSAMVDLLCGALTGANWGPFVPPFPYNLPVAGRSVGLGIGHLFGAFRIDGFIDPDEFKSQVDEWVRTMRATRPAPGTRGPLIPGDPERAAEAARRRDGIPLLPSVVEDLRSVSAQTQVPFD